LCINHLVARPHVASLPLLVIWLIALVRARSNNAAPPLYLALLMTLWANLHGGFLFGLALAVLFTAEAVFEAATMSEARAAGRRWGAFLGASVLAALITPYGLTGLLFPIQLVSMGPALDNITEWQPSNVVNNPPLLLWLFLFLFVSLLQGLRLPICRLIMLMLLLYMALAHRRHTELLGLAAPLLIQHAIAERLSQTAPTFPSNWFFLARPAVNAALAGAAVTIVGLVTLLLCVDLRRGPDIYTPAAALAAIEAQGIRGPVLNAQGFGGYLIFRGYAPFIDGRVDLYGDAFMSRYSALDQLPALLEQYHIAWTIFDPANPRTVLLDHLSGWSRLYTDSTTVVHIRR
jgi:hypothetical protein